MLEFNTALLVYLFFLASQWFHTFKSLSNLHFLGLAFQSCFWNRISHIFWDSTSHKNTCMHFVGINCLFREFKVVFIDRWSFYTGSFQDRFHCNSPSKIPQLTSISWTVHIMNHNNGSYNRDRPEIFQNSLIERMPKAAFRVLNLSIKHSRPFQSELKTDKEVLKARETV